MAAALPLAAIPLGVLAELRANLPGALRRGAHRQRVASVGDEIGKGAGEMHKLARPGEDAATGFVAA